MRKMIAAAASIAMLGAGLAVVSSGPSVPMQTEARSAPAQAPQPVQAPAQSKAIREQRSIGDAIRAMRIPTAHKNRAGGERANRRWRKQRASGRA